MDWGSRNIDAPDRHLRVSGDRCHHRPGEYGVAPARRKRLGVRRPLRPPWPQHRAVVAAAAVGAILGDNVGYWIGRGVRIPAAAALRRPHRPDAPARSSSANICSFATAAGGVLRPFRRHPAHARRLVGRGQPDGLAAVPARQCGRRILWASPLASAPMRSVRPRCASLGRSVLRLSSGVRHSLWERCFSPAGTSRARGRGRASAAGSLAACASRSGSTGDMKTPIYSISVGPT